MLASWRHSRSLIEYLLSTLGSHSTPERSMSASFHDERIGGL
jgi:hypothetical protein